MDLKVDPDSDLYPGYSKGNRKILIFDEDIFLRRGGMRRLNKRYDLDLRGKNIWTLMWIQIRICGKEIYRI